MKSSANLVLIPLLLFFTVGCKSQGNAPAIPFLSKTELLAEYDSLCAALREAHGGLYRFHSKEEIEKHFVNYRGRINDKSTKHEYIALLMEMLAYIGDGHMRLEYDAATMDAFSKAKTLPFRTFFEGDRLVVMYNESQNDETIKPGMEILEINGHKAADLLKTILPKLPHDGFIETGKKRRLDRNFAIGYWLFIEQTENFKIKAKDEKGTTVNTELTGVTTAEREGNRAKNPVNAQLLAQAVKLDGSKENISYRFINDTVATMRVRNFVDAGFTSSVDEAMSKLAKAKTIILDLRGNGGGADMWGAWLVSKFTAKPFRYFDRIHLPTINPSFTNWKQESKDNMKNNTMVDPSGGFLATPQLHPGLGEQAPADNPFTGKLIVLADGLTFSTATDVCAQLRNRTNTIFVGEETGGGYAGNTSGTNARFNFPHSDFRLSIHVYDYWNAVPAREKGRGIMPDFTIENKVKELEQGVDAQWEQALQLTR